MHWAKNIFRAKICSKDPDTGMSNLFIHTIRSLKIRNVFNPSFYIDENVIVFAFRAVPEGDQLLVSYVCIKDQSGLRIINLTRDLCGTLKVPRVIDPKIFQINGEIFVTFNTGFIPAGNDIFVMSVYPELGRPEKMVYRDRRRQERNWAFFSAQNAIFALYEINPLKILKLKKSNGESWEMDNYVVENKRNMKLSKNYTIGTQLCQVADGKYYFIAHKKFYLPRKKLYLGKCCILDFQKMEIQARRKWLFHSPKSLLGAKTKHNTNLLSCTYFSGIQVEGKSVRLAYGINDISYGFSVHKIDEL